MRQYENYNLSKQEIDLEEKQRILQQKRWEILNTPVFKEKKEHDHQR